MTPSVKYIFIVAIAAPVILITAQMMSSDIHDRAVIEGGIYLKDFKADHYYAVFGEQETQENGPYCALISGEELVIDNNLRNYGTCFINDVGTFTLVELSSFMAANYLDTINSEVYVGQNIITMIPADEGVFEVTPLLVEGSPLATSTSELVLETSTTTAETLEAVDASSSVGTINTSVLPEVLGEKIVDGATSTSETIDNSPEVIQDQAVVDIPNVEILPETIVEPTPDELISTPPDEDITTGT